MTDEDLIARLRGWARDIQQGSKAVWAMDQDLKASADRIEELEAKLAKALAVMEESEIMLRLRGQAYMADAIAATLAEIKGGSHE